MKAETKSIILSLIIFIVSFVSNMAMIAFVLQLENTSEPTPEYVTYKGVNGENITDLGNYGGMRIAEVEGFKEWEVIEIPSNLENTKLFMIIFDNDSTWLYMYSWNEYGTVDDTWTRQDFSI